MSTATWAEPDLSLLYPDSDGKPMADNTVQFDHIMMIKGGLDVVFSDREDVFVAGDLLWYPVEGAPEIRVAPDVMVVLGRPKGHRRSYLQWREDGVAPQVVFEIVSPRSAVPDMLVKTVFYQQYGVLEYYIYDPALGELYGLVRDGTALKPVEAMEGWTSPLLEIRFELGPLAPPDAPTDTPRRPLRVFGPDGRPFSSFAALAAERNRAEAERNRAEAERDAERERAERLAARLRELGVDPEA
jgi:Uma2 family endonuclease